MTDQQTIQSVIQGLGDDLRAYLEAQYHVRDESLLHERKLLLKDGDTIAQTPFLEATPAYKLSDEYAKLDLPKLTKILLAEMSQIEKSGIYPKPYGHQAKALKAFLKDQKDVLAATGTGSGKTEIFLLSILGSLAEECALGEKVTRLAGFRALILYPMNALVSDQLARMRRVLGNKEVAALLKGKRGRPARFGMYTSRTPFPGDITSDLNKSRCRDLLQNFYRPILENPLLLSELKARGKWPEKDIAAFFGEDRARWENRLKTSSDDVELLMRHEIQTACPDILITNYSMLEYMMLRPIERSIFEQTARWLENKGTFLTIVLDEAHMYRGATGAEVAFLLRRLFARLGVKRDRVRFILTTASVGPTSDDEAAARDFACDLTGLSRTKRHEIEFVRGTKEEWKSPAPANLAQATALAAFDGGSFATQMHDQVKSAAMLNALGQELGWASLAADTVANDLYSRVSQFGPAKLLVTEVSGNAVVLDRVAATLFPDVPDDATRAKALDALLRICNFARDSKTDRVFLPARLHLFFRGLSGLYGCVNPQCIARRDTSKTTLLGKLYPEPRVFCECGSRVFEILTHRDCGAMFLKGYVPRQLRPTFLWHEPTTGIGDESTGAELTLQEMQLLVTPEAANNPAQPAWLNVASGQLSWDEPEQKDQWLPVFAPDTSAALTAEISHVFNTCPQCGARTRNSPNEPSRIMDLRTKGEQPFGQLVKRQLFSQAPDGTKKPDDFPNQGRKVLIFSDGRQKAARLAKAIPDEVESDAFRELLARGYAKLNSTKRERLPLQKSYAPFIAACADAKVSPFSGNDAQQVRDDIRSFREIFAEDLDAYIEDCPPTSPVSFRAQLYRQACGGLYSMRFICAGWLAPSPRFLKPVSEKFPEEKRKAIEEAALTWVQWLASDTAIDSNFERRRRAEVAGFDKPAWAHKGTFKREIAKALKDQGFNSADIEKPFQDTFAFFNANEGGFYLKPETLVLKIALDHKWFRCRACFSDSPFRLLGHCSRCGSPDVAEFDPNTDPYIQSRKGYWRNPVKAAHDGQVMPRLLSAEEHTAQLSHKEATSGWVKTEEYELRFQDVLADPKNKPAVDVLSCTTTMEVGIDIGSLVAVGLRNVPPQRENYQQRAGRAGRRGSAVSTVVTYCQGGAHDNHYYSHVDEIASGAPRKLTVKVDNSKIARRHVRSFLLQEFFAEREGVSSPDVLSSLGTLQSFFEETGEGSLQDFSQWTNKKVAGGIGAKVKSWLGEQLEDVKDVATWATAEAKDFAAKLEGLKSKAQEMITREAAMDDSERTKLLEFFLAEAILPTYAFPTDLTTFRVEDWDSQVRNLIAKYAPQQAIGRALSEYAPGRLLTIDKGTYKSAAVTANVSLTEPHRARPLFTNPHRKPYVFCDQKHCCYVEDVGDQKGETRENADCPLCGVGKLRVVEMITPEVFLPDDGREVSALDDDADFSYATPAQFPVPLHHTSAQQQLVGTLTEQLQVFRRADAQLVIVNKGDPEDQSGFCVCDACGRATLAKVGAPSASHNTPYKILAGNRANARIRRCDGQIRSPVFLGHRFVTDLVILRIQLPPPLSQAPRALGADYCALQDALQTLADALPLAAGRMFDVDYTEFSAGYRLITQSGNGSGSSLAAEIYMFDTLSGGAGYSERVGDSMEELLRKYVRKVLACDDENHQGCDRSCYRCLRHYYNQFYHTRLDRHLASDLLDLILDGKNPKDPEMAGQKSLLQGLKAMLELDGFQTDEEEKIDGVTIPLVARTNGQSVAVCVTHALVAEQFRTGLVDELDGTAALLRPLNAYQLTRNLPSCHLAVRKCLGLPHS